MSMVESGRAALGLTAKRLSLAAWRSMVAIYTSKWLAAAMQV